jgi:hypothetical protein
MLEILAREIRKERKAIQIVKEVKLSVCADDTILHRKELKALTKTIRTNQCIQQTCRMNNQHRKKL